MQIEIHDAAIEARLRKQIRATGATNAEEALVHLLDTQEEQDRWLMEHRDEINAKIRRGIAQLERGEGSPEGCVREARRPQDQPRLGVPYK